MLIENLENTELEEIHKAFIDAFSEYEIQIDMPIAKLEEMLVVRSLHKGYSVCCRIDDTIAGFALIGYRLLEGKRTIYDIATGTIKQYQNQGVGGILIRSLKEAMVRDQLDRFQLEVLENNIAAQKLYEKNGFAKSRKLKCYSTEKNQLREPEVTYEIAEDDSLLQTIREEDYLGYQPAWQNSLLSYQNLKTRYRVVVLKDKTEIAGYGLVHKENGDILQLGINPRYRNENIEGQLVGLLKEKTTANELKILNIEADSVLSHKIEKMGFENLINQFEMVLSMA